MRNGVLAALGAYIMWGVFPVYFKLLKTVSAGEILAHRIVWCFLLVTLVLLVQRKRGWLRLALRTPRTRNTLIAAALLLSVNWFVYIWAVNSGNVVAASLGYFINPLVSVLLGQVFLHERLRWGQWLAIGLAVAGVVYLTILYGQLPWISIILALTFGFYGLLKKTMKLNALRSLGLETAVMTIPALAYLFYLGGTAQIAFGQQSQAVTVLLLLAGPITALPLVLFGYGAQRIPLYMLGLAQYLAPTLQFLLGVFIYGEPFSQAQLVGFCLIWAALVAYSLEEFFNWRRRTAAVPVQA